MPTDEKQKLLSLIKKVVNHPHIKSGKITLYNNYKPDMDKIIISEHEYLVPKFIIMSHYESVGYHLAWCRGSYLASVKEEIQEVKLTLSLLNDNDVSLFPIK